MDNLDIEREFRQYAELQQALEDGDMGVGGTLSDLVAITATKGKSAIDLTEKITELIGKTQNLDLVEKAVDLKTVIIDLKRDLNTARDEALALEAENKKLKAENNDLLDAYEYTNNDKHGDLEAEVEQLRAENKELKAKVERLKERAGPDLGNILQNDQNLKRVQDGIQ